MRVLELCAGYGGFGLGVRIAIPAAHVVGLVERQAYCAAILMERLGAAALGGPALWPELESFNAVMARRNRGRLGIADPRGFADMVCAGFPCQPFSQAGKRRGTRDERWLWPAVRRAIALVRPRYVFLENVSGLLADSGGIGTVLGNLDALGYDTIRDRIPAADVGANHFRFRVWILAHARGGAGRPGLRSGRARSERRRRPCNTGGALDAEHYALRGGSRRTERRPVREALQRGTPAEATNAAQLLGNPLERSAAHGYAPGLGTLHTASAESGGFAGGRRPQESSGFPIGVRADDSNAPGAGLEKRHRARSDSEPTHPATPAPERRNAEPAPGGMDDEPTQELCESWYGDLPYPPEEWLTRDEPDRAEQLHALGNGIVPEQCALALVLLACRAGWGAWTREGLVLAE